MVGVLAEVVRRVDDDALGVDAEAYGALGQATGALDDVGDDVAVVDSVR